MDMTPQAWPDWYDGRHINEVLFCQQFLDKHPMKCVRGRLFTVDGLIEDEGQISNLILEEISGVLTSGLSKVVTNLLASIKLQAYSPPLPIETDIKSIVTSECKMDMERKGVQSYQSQLYVRFLCFGNGALTALHDKSDGFFRRQIVLTTKDRPTGRADDPFLVDKLLREREGIFLWCLEGLHRLIGNNYQFSISGKARENMETVKRSSNNVIEFLQSEGYIRFKADSEASSKAIYEAYTRWCDDNAQKPMSANRVSSELAQNERLYNIEATNNVHVGGKRVRGFIGIEVINPLPC